MILQARQVKAWEHKLAFFWCATGEADDSSASVETEEKETTGEEEEEQKEEEVQEEAEAAEKEEESEECEQEPEKDKEGAEEDSGILSDKERQNEEVNEKDNCSASSISSASSTLEREERGSNENGGSFCAGSILTFKLLFKDFSQLSLSWKDWNYHLYSYMHHLITTLIQTFHNSKPLQRCHSEGIFLTLGILRIVLMSGCHSAACLHSVADMKLLR